jgi:hypothetical protein
MRVCGNSFWVRVLFLQAQKKYAFIVTRCAAAERNLFVLESGQTIKPIVNWRRVCAAGAVLLRPLDKISARRGVTSVFRSSTFHGIRICRLTLPPATLRVQHIPGTARYVMEGGSGLFDAGWVPHTPLLRRYICGTASERN